MVLQASRGPAIATRLIVKRLRLRRESGILKCTLSRSPGAAVWGLTDASNAQSLRACACQAFANVQVARLSTNRVLGEQSRDVGFREVCCLKDGYKDAGPSRS